MGRKGKDTKRRARAKARQAPLSDSADRFLLYQQSVQSPEADIEFFVARFRERFGRAPRSLREDFCGTALLTSTWVRQDSRRRALAIDLDPEPLAWGRRHNFTASDLERVQLVRGDVREVGEPRVDLACAMNFSFCTFKKRQELAAYFATVHAALAPEGLLLCELYGGTEAIVELEERREVEDFTFVWEQKRFNPITNETRCHIHFELADGSRLKRAFTYDWRLWSIPEVEELMLEAGFDQVDVYWEDVDDDGDGTGSYRLTREEENQEGWLVYVVATKGRSEER